MITRLSYTGLMGRTESFELAAVNLVVGPNSSAKSTILHAAYLDLLGFHPDPKIGKLRENIRQLGTEGQPLAVSSQHKVGDLVFARSQTWWKKYEVSDGSFPFAPSLLVGMEEFYSGKMTAAGRLAFLLERSTLPPEYTVESTIEKLKPVPAYFLDEFGEGEDVGRQWTHSVTTVGSLAKGQPFIAWLNEAKALAADKLKNAKLMASGAQEALTAAELEDSKPENVARDRSQDIAAAERHKAAIEAADRERSDKYKAAVSDARSVTAELSSLRDRLAATKQTTWACPTCKHVHTKKPSQENAAVINGSIAQLEARYAKYTSEMETLNKEGEPVAAAISEAQRQIEVLRQEQRRWDNAQGRAQARSEHRKTVRRGKLAMAAYKLLGEKLVEITDQAVAVGLQSTLGPANALIEPVLGSPVEFRDGDFAWRGHLATLSGSEKIIVFAGLQLALTQQHKEPILIVDELGRVDAQRKVRLINQVSTMVSSGLLQQFIGVDVTDSWLVSTGAMVKVIYRS